MTGNPDVMGTREAGLEPATFGFVEREGQDGEGSPGTAEAVNQGDRSGNRQADTGPRGPRTAALCAARMGAHERAAWVVYNTAVGRGLDDLARHYREKAIPEARERDRRERSDAVLGQRLRLRGAK